MSYASVLEFKRKPKAPKTSMVPVLCIYSYVIQDARGYWQSSHGGKMIHVLSSSQISDVFMFAMKEALETEYPGLKKIEALKLHKYITPCGRANF